MTNIKSIIRRGLYHSGILGAIHRVRNRRALTTLMFHRVLPVGGAGYACAEREFTFTVEGFGRCLDFVKRHYNVVRLQDVRDAITRDKLLPPNPALITIDDGWRDSMLYAAPELKRRGLSAVLFLSTEVLTSPYDRWWQDALVRVLADGDASVELAEALGLGMSDQTQQFPRDNMRIAAALAALPEPQRFKLLATALPGVLNEKCDRQMLVEADIDNLDRAYIELAAHGHTHAPLTELSFPVDDLQQSFNIISAIGTCPAAMSFPHGRYDTTLLEAARKVGFQLAFTSVAALSPLRGGRNGLRGIGRIHIPENRWTVDRGRVSFPHLATFLFFRRHES